MELSYCTYPYYEPEFGTRVSEVGVPYSPGYLAVGVCHSVIVMINDKLIPYTNNGQGQDVKHDRK